MFRLYDKNTNEKLNQGTEEEIIGTMGMYLKEDEDMRFRIIHYDEITTIPSWFSINSKIEYIEYKKEYEYRKLTEKTCMELKKEIVEAPKIKKFTKK